MAGPKRQAEIATELRRASTWVGGPRRAKLVELALELEGTDADQIEEKAAEVIKDLDTPTVADTETQEATKAEAKKAAEAKAKPSV
jgi:hypothetical protein